MLKTEADLDQKQDDYWKHDSQLIGGHVTSAGKKEKNHPR